METDRMTVNGIHGVSYTPGNLYRLCYNDSSLGACPLKPVLCLAVNVLDMTAVFCTSVGSLHNEETEDFSLAYDPNDKDTHIHAKLNYDLIGHPLNAYAMGTDIYVDPEPITACPHEYEWWCDGSDIWWEVLDTSFVYDCVWPRADSKD